jgi:hypothetical protein
MFNKISTNRKVSLISHLGDVHISYTSRKGDVIFFAQAAPRLSSERIAAAQAQLHTVGNRWTCSLVRGVCLSCNFLESYYRLLLQKNWLCESYPLKKLRGCLFGLPGSFLRAFCCKLSIVPLYVYTYCNEVV